MTETPKRPWFDGPMVILLVGHGSVLAVLIFGVPWLGHAVGEVIVSFGVRGPWWMGVLLRFSNFATTYPYVRLATFAVLLLLDAWVYHHARQSEDDAHATIWWLGAFGFLWGLVILSLVALLAPFFTLMTSVG